MQMTFRSGDWWALAWGRYLENFANKFPVVSFANIQRNYLVWFVVTYRLFTSIQSMKRRVRNWSPLAFFPFIHTALLLSCLLEWLVDISSHCWCQNFPSLLFSLAITIFLSHGQFTLSTLWASTNTIWNSWHQPKYDGCCCGQFFLVKESCKTLPCHLNGLLGGM